MRQNILTSDRAVSIVDALSVSLSVLCFIHCLMTPIVVIFLPMWGASLFTHEMFHELLLILVVPASVFALGMGCHRHRSFTVAGLGILGVACLAFGAFAGHEMLGESGEEVFTILGGLVLATAHLINYSHCRHECHSDVAHQH